MSVKLTQGAVKALFTGSDIRNPVLQLLVSVFTPTPVDLSRHSFPFLLLVACQNIRKIGNDANQIKFRLHMSDGLHSLSSFILASQQNSFTDEDLLVPNCVCMLKETTNKTLPDGRCVVLVLNMKVIQSAAETGGVIGNPTPYQSDKEKTQSPQKVGPSTSVPVSPPPAAVPGPSHRYNTASPSRGRGRGFTGKSPTKAAGTSSRSSPKVIPVASLNPYQSNWTIRVRVTNKSNVRTWSNSRGDGKLFSFEVVDESGEIKVTAFNNEVDKFFPLVEKGKVYFISMASLKVANKQYTTLNNNYEMTLHANTSIAPCDDNEGVPTLQCDFVPIAQLEKRDKDSIVDVIGVCKCAEEVSRITTKSSREVSKRALSLMDTTATEVTVTLWGEEAEKFDASRQPVVAIKGARLSDFGGRSLSALFSSTVMVNPDIPEAFRLRAWFDREGRAANSQSLSDRRSTSSGSQMNWKTLSEVKDGNMGHGEKAEYFSCVATIVFMRKDSCLYQACPSADCNKKVVDLQNGRYRCEKCNREYPDFKYRLILSANLADYGDNQWVTCFQETAEVLLGHNAERLGELRDTDDAAFDNVFQKANFKTHIFQNRVKLETYNDESRVKVTVMQVRPVDHREHSRRLLGNIRILASGT
ncbi:replication protein A 70 kDa DNA-binding subunit-like isoform X2 [Genypterus blacodes]|uniref:replication protein A 70 kDa DNA-binding subunit-like isoform X2 n=1 Tax=Genypterus blacodes TaxID=154954 RepID=UPI003F76DF42